MTMMMVVIVCSSLAVTWLGWWKWKTSPPPLPPPSPAPSPRAASPRRAGARKPYSLTIDTSSSSSPVDLSTFTASPSAATLLHIPPSPPHSPNSPLSYRALDSFDQPKSWLSDYSDMDHDDDDDDDDDGGGGGGDQDSSDQDDELARTVRRGHVRTVSSLSTASSGESETPVSSEASLLSSSEVDDVEEDEDEDEGGERSRMAREPLTVLTALSQCGALDEVGEQQSLEVLAEIMGLTPAQLERDYNDEFQEWVDRAAPTPHEQLERGEALSRIKGAFDDVATAVCKYVAGMVRRRPITWTLHPLDKGLAGGLKFRVGTLLTKVSLATGAAARLYNGDQSLMRKASCCEQRAYSAILRQNVPGAHPALSTHVEDRGLEVTAFAMLPIDGKLSLQIGSDNAGKVVHCATEGVVADAVERLGVAFRLKRHGVVESSTGHIKMMWLAGDVEGHLSETDGRAYILDAGRFFPPTSPFIGSLPYPFIHQFRPEFMRRLPLTLEDGTVIRALSADGFSRWGRPGAKEHHAELKAAWRHVLTVLAPEVAQSLTEEEDLPSLLLPPADPHARRPLAQRFHAAGVNLRCLLIARASLSPTEHPDERSVLLLECVVRALKALLRKRMIEIPGPNDAHLLHAVHELLDGRFSRVTFWTGTLLRQIQLSFITHVPPLPEPLSSQFKSDCKALRHDLAALHALSSDDPLSRALSACVSYSLPCVRRDSTGRWTLVTSVTPAQLPAYGDVASAVQRLETEIEVRKQGMGAHSMEVFKLQVQMLEVYQNFVHQDAAHTLELASALISEVVESAGKDPERSFGLVIAAHFWQHAAQYGRAKSLLKRCLRVREAALGPDHPDVGSVCGNLASNYGAEGRYKSALPLAERALRIEEAALGPDHPSVATACNNLAMLYSKQGKGSEALRLHERALRIREAALDPQHPHIATSCNNLASLYKAEARYAEALPLYERALRIEEAALGPDHPSVATACNNLAALHSSEGKYAEAVRLHERALRIRELVHGPEHPQVAMSCNNMGALLLKQGKYADARKMYARALRIKEGVLRANHPAVATACHNLAALCRLEGKAEDARDLYERALHIRESVLGAEHAHVATTCNGLAQTLTDLGRHADALELFQRALRLKEAAHSAEHPSVATTCHNFAELRLEQGDLDAAQALLERALRIRQSACGADHPHTAMSMHVMGQLHAARGDGEAALESFERALEVKEAALGQEHPEVALTLVELAKALLAAGRGAERAERLCRRALGVCQVAFPEGHRRVAAARECLERAVEERGG